MLGGLAFLPPERVSEGMNLLKQQVPEGLFDLVEYFDTTYVHGPLKAIPGVCSEQTHQDLLLTSGMSMQ